MVSSNAQEATELEISRVLEQVGGDPAEALAVLRSELAESHGDSPNTTSVIRFAWNSGLYRQAFEIFAEIFANPQARESLPWADWIALLGHAEVKADADLLEKLASGITATQSEKKLGRLAPWVLHHEPFSSWQEEERQQVFMTHRFHRQELLDSLQYYRTNGMLAEEKQQLKRLLRAFPEDPHLDKWQTDFDVRWAEHIVSRRWREPEAGAREEKSPAFSPEEQRLIDLWLSTAVNQARQKPEKARDLSFLFYFIGAFNEALVLIRLAPPGWPEQWFEIELLILCRKYLEALDRLAHISESAGNDPELAFASTYFRAQCYYGLGQRAEAIDLLEGITQIRPHYRTAESLLRSWKEQRS